MEYLQLRSKQHHLGLVLLLLGVGGAFNLGQLGPCISCLPHEILQQSINRLWTLAFDLLMVTSMVAPGRVLSHVFAQH